MFVLPILCLWGLLTSHWLRWKVTNWGALHPPLIPALSLGVVSLPSKWGCGQPTFKMVCWPHPDFPALPAYAWCFNLIKTESSIQQYLGPSNDNHRKGSSLITYLNWNWKGLTFIPSSTCFETILSLISSPGLVLGEAVPPR